MGSEIQESATVEDRIGSRFDEILGRHVKRLLGARYGIGGLPVTINAISCIMLLAEQLKNEQRGSAPSGQYTRQMLCAGLTEMCLDADEVMDTAIPDMIQRDYIQIDPDFNISIKEDTVRMAQILDHIFPKMPGINLVAYLAQTMEEVKTERKSLETARDQFDQTLKIHGVALKKKQAPGKQEPSSAASVVMQRALKREMMASLTERRRPVRNRVIKGSDADALYQKSVTGKKKAPTPPADAAPPPGGSPDQDTKGKKADTVQLYDVQEDCRAEAESMPCEGDASLRGDIDAATPDMSPEPLADASRPAEAEKAPHDFPSDREETSPQPEAEMPAPVSAPEGTPEEERTEPPQTADAKADEQGAEGVDTRGGIPDRDDDVIGRKIVAFEEGLAMQCPICRVADIRSQETSTGKFYYVCSDKNCTFISWGKPYHLACPDCGSPFLVESSPGDGKMILKCPRATCLYWQRHPSDTSGGDERRDTAPSRASRDSKAEHPIRRRVVKRKKVVRKKR